MTDDKNPITITTTTTTEQPTIQDEVETQVKHKEVEEKTPKIPFFVKMELIEDEHSEN